MVHQFPHQQWIGDEQVGVAFLEKDIEGMQAFLEALALLRGQGNSEAFHGSGG